MQFYTYLHCKPDGTPFYVGKGADRRSHSNKSRNKHHKNTTAKYGWENILVYVFPCDSEAQALADEIQQIAQLRREGYGLCNLTDGGEGCSGLVHTFETRRNLANTSAGNRNAAVPCSAKKAARISAALIGSVPWNKGKKVLPEHAANIAAKKRGTKHTAETRAKMSAAHKGKVMSHKGKPWSEDRRAAQHKRNSLKGK